MGAANVQPGYLGVPHSPVWLGSVSGQIIVALSPATERALRETWGAVEAYCQAGWGERGGSISGEATAGLTPCDD